jgi:SAM-dependent methyltransferase
MIQQELDCNKLETVLEIGVGYGRIAKLMLEVAPNIRRYDGIDISEDQLAKSRDYVNHDSYWGYRFDFDDILEYNWPKSDLVLCTEVMTCFPYDVKPWIDKMVAMSKKYVVNLDHWVSPREKSLEDNILRNWHPYNEHYNNNKDVIHMKCITIPAYSQGLFLARVR